MTLDETLLASLLSSRSFFWSEPSAGGRLQRQWSDSMVTEDGWVYYLAVDPDFRGLSYGKALMLEAERLLIARGCPKLNLLVRSSNKQVIEFYLRLGYGQDDVVSLSRRLISDLPSQES